MKATLKRLRASRHLNSIVTGALRTSLRTVGARPELVIKHVHRVGDVTSGLPNGRTLRLWSKGDDWVSNQVFWRGWAGYEPESAPLFFRLAQRSEVVFDVGAFVGFYSLLAGHANTAARVFAFEPLPTIFERLKSNVRLNELPNVSCQNAAAGAEDGTADFFHTDGLPTSSSLSFGYLESVPGLMRSTVRVVSLDRFAAENGVSRVDLLKIDTETTEPEVLRGMAGILGRDKPHMVCEVLKGRGRERDLEALLAPAGYEYFLLTEQGPVRKERIEGHETWLNYLFAHRSAADDVLRVARGEGAD